MTQWIKRSGNNEASLVPRFSCRSSSVSSYEVSMAEIHNTILLQTFPVLFLRFLSVSLALFLCFSQISLLIALAQNPHRHQLKMFPSHVYTKSRTHSQTSTIPVKEEEEEIWQHWSPTHTHMHLLTYLKNHWPQTSLPSAARPMRTKERGKVFPGQWKTERMVDVKRNGDQEQMEEDWGRNKRLGPCIK